MKCWLFVMFKGRLGASWSGGWMFEDDVLKCGSVLDDVWIVLL